MFDLPSKYAKRLVDDGESIRVYGDTSRIVMLGIVKKASDAVRLLDGYDGQLSRRRLIAEKILKENGNGENEDANQITERLRNHI